MLNNQYKSSHNLVIGQISKLFAGLKPSDSAIEFIGIKETKKVIWMQNGNTHYFMDLPVKYFNLIRDAYMKDKKAREYLERLEIDFPRQLELYTYYMYGDLDDQPDIVDGKLMKAENFRDNPNCPSLLWNKQITIDGKPLTSRELFITDMFASDIPDKAIAIALNISQSHLDTLKRRLYEKAGVMTKTAYVLKAQRQNVIREFDITVTA